MTILNACVERHQVVVASDTLLFLPDGKALETSKLLLIPGSNVVLACRGLVVVMVEVFARCLVEGWSFDECVLEAAPIFRDVVKRTRAANRDAGVPAAFRGEQQTLLFAGWSDRYGHMLATRFEMNKDALTRHDVLPGWGFLSPRSEEDNRPAPADPDMVLAIARVQVDWMRVHEPAMAAGGDLVIATMRRDATTTQRFARFTEEESTNV